MLDQGAEGHALPLAQERVGRRSWTQARVRRLMDVEAGHDPRTPAQDRDDAEACSSEWYFWATRSRLEPIVRVAQALQSSRQDKASCDGLRRHSPIASWRISQFPLPLPIESICHSDKPYQGCRTIPTTALRSCLQKIGFSARSAHHCSVVYRQVLSEDL